MLQTLLNDKLWLKLKTIILDLNIYDKPNLRNIFTGILYRLKTGCPWRYLPEYFGKYNTVFKTFRRWTKLDKFTKIFKQLIKDPDMEWLSIDGTTHNVKVVPELIKKVELKETKILNADRGYISEDFKTSLLKNGVHPNIPNRKNSLKDNRHMDWHIYKARHVVENMFATLKHFRGLATRYDKLKSSYSSNVALACAYVWLKL
ncbi:transposase [Wohlfahrtiimonas chitiniclastica]|uniref:transposase n=1 Tax=Wohlfahrtiimonas chitiniclastica TaxID=400946 RepID=UPI001BCAB4FF|nr:transposase [Wohlfahrtiimonas chitiniclastica]MBS7829352.1 transposase [Wohlfahrtiimonas chitiniclastica]